MNENTVAKECGFIKPDIHEVEFLPDDIIEDCRNKYFHRFEYTPVYDMKFKNISNFEEVNFTITHRSMEFKSEF